MHHNGKSIDRFREVFLSFLRHRKMLLPVGCSVTWSGRHCFIRGFRGLRLTPFTRHRTALALTLYASGEHTIQFRRNRQVESVPNQIQAMIATTHVQNAIQNATATSITFPLYDIITPGCGIAPGATPAFALSPVPAIRQLTHW